MTVGSVSIRPPRYRELPKVGNAAHPTLDICWQTVWSVSDVEQYEAIMEELATSSHWLIPSLIDFCNQSHGLLKLTDSVAQD